MHANESVDLRVLWSYANTNRYLFSIISFGLMMARPGLTEKVIADRSVSFYFPSCGPIPPPVIMVQVTFFITSFL